MEEKVSEGILQKLKVCDSHLEQLRSSLDRKQLLLARLAHNWSCPSPVPLATLPAALREPVVVPITAPDAVFTQHEVLALGRAPENCENFANVEVHERCFHEQWVIVVEVEKSPDLVVEGLLPVSGGSDAEQVSWTIAVVSSTTCRVVLVAARPLPTFCGTEEAARVTLLLRCADERYLPCGEAQLSWRQLLENPLVAVPDTQTEFEALPEKERRVARFVLDGLQCRLPLLVGRQSFESEELESSLETTWLRNGPQACRLRIMKQQMEDEEEEGVRVELRASDARTAALAARLLLLRPPSPRPGVRELQWLRRRFRRRVAALFSLLEAEVAMWCSEAGGPNLRSLRGASPAELSAALSEARAQRGARGPLPRFVRERLRTGARAAREAQEEL